MADARIPLEYRDYCAHLLIPLNKCRGETFYLPWKCENERHSYEKCQYEEYVTESFSLWTYVRMSSAPRLLGLCHYGTGSRDFNSCCTHSVFSFL